MDDRVKIAHPDIDAVGGPVTREAFELIWEPKGWRVVDDDETTGKIKRPRKAAPTSEG